MYPFREGSFAVRNGWYVAGFCEEIGEDLLARTFLNQPVVLYRKSDGTAVAVGGRCPHRHFPLGKSCREGDSIRCGYHGIAFGPDGDCTDVPSQTHIPRSYRIPTYPLVEHGLWAWIWMGDPEKADPALLPDLDDIGFGYAGMTAEPFFSEYVNGRYQLLNDNLLDLTHLGYLHGTSIGNRENASTPEELTREPGVLRSRRIIRKAPPPPMSAQFHPDLQGELIDRIVGMDFHLPGFHAGIGDMRLPDDHPTRAGEIISASRVYHAVTPATRTSCHYFFAMASNRGQSLDQSREYLRPVIAEDKMATEEIEKMLALIGEDPEELLLKSDRNAVEGRRALQAMMDAENGLAQPIP